MKEIANTGYWNGETAHIHHVHSENLSKWICEFIRKKNIETATDFGCGLGNYILDIDTNTHCTIIGVEGEKPKESKIPQYVYEYDLTHDLTGVKNLTSDLVISLEVGEHIPKEYMRTYLDNITYHAKEYLIISWAIRGQAGFGHVNCLDNHEIIPKIELMGFELINQDTEEARSIIEEKCNWFKNTIFVFKKKNINFVK